jgi:AmiR/NasT family two-component response regulator
MDEHTLLMDEIHQAGLLEAVEVHQAAGMIMERLGVSSVEAIAQLRAHAANTSRPLVDVACDVLAGQSPRPAPRRGAGRSRCRFQ